MSCASGGRVFPPPDEIADLQFAQQICRLWQLGPRTLADFFDELACRNFLRTALEKMLDEYLGDREGER